MSYYGFEHRYGANKRDDAGDMIGTLHIFASRAARDAWVADGNEFCTAPGARTAIKSKSAARVLRITPTYLIDTHD